MFTINKGIEGNPNISKGNDRTTKCELNPDDNGSNYVAYILKAPKSRTETLGAT